MIFFRRFMYIPSNKNTSRLYFCSYLLLLLSCWSKEVGAFNRPIITHNQLSVCLRAKTRWEEKKIKFYLSINIEIVQAFWRENDFMMKVIFVWKFFLNSISWFFFLLWHFFISIEKSILPMFKSTDVYCFVSLVRCIAWILLCNLFKQQKKSREAQLRRCTHEDCQSSSINTLIPIQQYFLFND